MAKKGSKGAGTIELAPRKIRTRQAVEGYAQFNFRVPVELGNAVKVFAAKNGATIGEVVTAGLREVLARGVRRAA